MKGIVRNMTNYRQKILSWIEEDRDEIVSFLSSFVAAPSPNPPGDTRVVANFLHRYLKDKGLPAEIRGINESLPNVVGSFECARQGRHLVLNGHLDVFPSEGADRWSRDPWSGAVEDGKVHGRGVTDMKAGTAASVWTYIYLHRLIDELSGRLTLTCVADEEMGGMLGARWLLDTYPDEFTGDCMLNGEPSEPDLLFIGEKGAFRVVFEVTTPGGHSAYPHLSENAIQTMTALLQEIYTLRMIPVDPGQSIREVIDNVVAKGNKHACSGVLDHVTVSPGVIQGGTLVNIIPDHCRVEVDFRLPFGITHAEMVERLQGILKSYPTARMTVDWQKSGEPNVSPPDHEMVRILKDTVKSLGLPEPTSTFCLAACDAKHWRHVGVPSYVYGCTPNNMAKPDEWVDIEEFLHVLRTHALSAAAYLG